MAEVKHINGRHQVPPGEIAAAMSEPGFYPQAPASVERRETHGSIVFLAGDRAYKIKKPVRFEFLDYSSLGVRRRMCEQEVTLNRRLAPATYLGVRSIVRGSGGFALAGPERTDALEYAVEMKRFDEARTLASCVARHAVGAGQIHELGALIARFHAGAAVVRGSDPRPAIRRATSQTFTDLLELAGHEREVDVVAAARFTDAFLVRRRDMFLRRAGAGLVRDCHGDIRAEHVLLGDPVEIVDCLEFDPALREIDVASDLAFLVMDLQRLGAGSLARELVAGYRAGGGDPGTPELIAFHAAQRAWLRAKVELLRMAQTGASGAHPRGRAEALIELGHRFAWEARRPLILVVCGLSGSGKSHLASALATRSGLTAINSDVVRKQLGRLGGEDARPSLYTPAFDLRTYAELGRLAAAELEVRGAVIVDATFRRADDRQVFRETAGDAFAAARFVECLAPRELRLRRVERRQQHPGVSDATPAIAASQSFEELGEVSASLHLPLRADRPADSSVAEVERWLDSPLG